MGNFNLMQFALIISVSLSLISLSQSSEAGNWFSKSLDYFGLEKCSSLEKSGITGDFNTCLNSPVDSSSSSSSSSSPSASSTGSVSTKYPSGDGQAKSGSGNTNSNWGKFGSSGFPQVRGKRELGFGGFSTSGGSIGQLSFTGSSPPSSSTQSTSADSWPLSLIDDLQHMINCFPKLMKPCMIGSEVQFFNTIKNFFQAQVDYATPNASLIASVIASTGCVQGNSMDTSTVCYSTNIHKENWFGWKINWDDGQMCSFLGDLSKCETDSYSKCPPEVRAFADGLWKAGFKVTPCLDGTDDTVTFMSTTLSSPLPVTNNPDDQSKSLASSVSSFKVNQSPSRPTNTDSNDKQSLEVTGNSFTVDNVDSDRKSSQKEQEEEGAIRTKSMVPEKSRRRSIFDRMDDQFNQEDRFDGNIENENSDYSDEGFEVNNDKKERVHSEFRRVHNADIERHDRNQREREIEDEQFSRIKEEFRRKMRDSLDRRNSREYNEDDDDEEDKRFEIFEDRKDRFSSNRKNQEDERIRKYRKDQKDRKEREEEDRERQRNEAEAQRERQQEEEERRREYEERAREDERQRNERYERNQDKGEVSSRPERYSTKAIPNNYWYGNKNDNQVNNDGAKGSNYESIRKCFESSFNSWPSKNHNSGDIMDLICRKIESVSSCLDNKQSNGQSIGHLMSIHGILCDPSRNLNDIDIHRVRQCLTH